MVTTEHTSVRDRCLGTAMTAAALAPRWWMMAARGALALAFGGVISLWPNPTLPFVVVLFGLYAIVDGAWAIVGAVSVSERGRRLDPWPVALEGGISVVIGAVALWWPSVPHELVQIVAMWGVITGALELLTASALPRERAAHWLMGTSGICSIVLAILILLIPLADATHVVYLIAAYGIVFGVLTMSAAAHFRDLMIRAPRPQASR
jgi:uncharacterized membrane protein HdeD (DUF308 family)